jgi:hypothetical protein
MKESKELTGFQLTAEFLGDPNHLAEEGPCF